ncbi:MAG: YebC/PmpR family DNA-binding transcriptional regulator [Fidelibacterota bacterium]
MSGHSKWSTIKRKKAAQDAKRGKIFTTLIKEITVAARQGGGDEAANPRLRQAIQNARAANMPQENIKRAIMRGTGELPGVNYEEATYEGYGPGGVAILMEVLTDNRNRAVAEIRHIMTKNGGHLGENGSVAWMFETRGQITIPRNNLDEDTLLEAALECGAEDVTAEEEVYVLSTSPGELMTVREQLEAQGYTIESAQVEKIPKSLQKVQGSTAEQVLSLLEALADHDDVKNVFANVDLEETS